MFWLRCNSMQLLTTAAVTLAFVSSAEASLLSASHSDINNGSLGTSLDSVKDVTWTINNAGVTWNDAKDMAWDVIWSRAKDAARVTVEDDVMLPQKRPTRALLGKTVIPREMSLRVPGLVRLYGYPVEEHFVTTADGYILSLHRIPGPRYSKDTDFPRENQRVVLLMHGLYCTSLTFVLNGPESALGLLLADEGYDVWLGNFRGNTYSRNHTRLNPNWDGKFWHFSQDEMAEYDVPAMVDYIRRYAHVHRIFYVGYSQGTRVYYMNASSRESVVDKTRLFVALASTGARDLSGKQTDHLDIFGKNWRVPESLGVKEIMQRSPVKLQLVFWLCNPASSFHNICSNAMMTYFSNDPPARPLFSKAKVPFVAASLLGGASVRQLAHYSQLIRGVLQKFDFGSVQNFLTYGSKQPPPYNFSAVTCPTAVYWAPNDPLTSEKDVLKLLDVLPNVVAQYKVPHPYFNHLDFVYSDDVKGLLYDHVTDLMRQY